MSRPKVSDKVKVLKYYPNAIALKDELGLYYIGIPKPRLVEDDEFDDLDSLLDDNNIYSDLLAEYFLSHTLNEDAAWTAALISCKTTQNFNRTHPERMILDHEDEDRIIRLAERSERIQISRMKK